jgi:hypothetical protein
METPAQMCARLVAALEDLSSQEAISLQTRNFAAAISIQERAAPLVEHLAVHGPEVADELLRCRIAALLERRHETGRWLVTEIERTRQQLHAMDVNRRRVAQVAPVYGAGVSAGRRQLSAVG